MMLDGHGLALRNWKSSRRSKKPMVPDFSRYKKLYEGLRRNGEAFIRTQSRKQMSVERLMDD